jgi:ADP-ribosyl-[dinitrogen reductase] hydrolase
MLVEMGEEPKDAVRRVRMARPGAIETSGQEEHVFTGARPRGDAAVLDRILGCLLGGAVGDAMGYAVEFDRWPQIKARFGAQGIAEPVVHNGKINVSDDTQMTLFTLEGLTRSMQAGKQHDSGAIIDNIRLAYRDWLAT